MNKKLLWLLGASAISIFAIYGYYVSKVERQTPRHEPPPAPPITEQPPPPLRQAAPPPIVAAPALPALENSDTLTGNALAHLFGKDRFLEYFYKDKIILRIVATIDNLPRRKAPRGMMPVKPVAGPFLVEDSASGPAIGPANAARYDAYVNMIQAIDVASLVDTYIRFYPLFQQAYRDLGYPKGFFQDRLVEAMDDMLAAPEIPAAISVSQPKVLYTFTDNDLKNRSAGQKILMRIGNDNATKVKAVLKAIRAELMHRMSGN